MPEIYVSEEDEERLKRAALDKVFLAFLTLEIARSPDQVNYLAKIKQLALGLEQTSNHSENPEINDYARKQVEGTIEAYLDQIQIGPDRE